MLPIHLTIDIKREIIGGPVVDTRLPVIQHRVYLGKVIISGVEASLRVGLTAVATRAMVGMGMGLKASGNLTASEPFLTKNWLVMRLAMIGARYGPVRVP